MITTAAARHLGGIRELWLQAFGADTGYADLFLRRRARLSDTLVYLRDDCVCGMLFILPCRLVFGGEGKACAYIYGVATDEACRGQGISTRLMRYAYELCGSRGYELCALVPADKPLFDFYARRGYHTQGYVKTLTVTAGQLNDVKGTAALSCISSREVVNMRRAAFGGEDETGYLEWDESAIDYAIVENHYMGGSFYRCSFEDAAGYLCCQPWGNSLLIKEFTGSATQLYETAAALHRVYQKTEYLFRLSNAANIGELQPFAMTIWMDKGTDKPFYLSHVLD